MKATLNDLAIFGGKKLFGSILPVGQINIPPWSDFEKLVNEIFDRRYYSNHGVLAQKFEEQLCELFKTRHAITVTNATIGLSLACKALQLPAGGKVIVPSFTFAATVQALSWAGLKPVFCDIDPQSHNITAQTVSPLLSTQDICAILGVNLWGNPCDIEGLKNISDNYGIPIFFDSAHAVGCSHNGTPFGSFGNCEIFSFHATKVLSATEGGCITTNDDDLAEKLRNLRSSYGRTYNVPIPINANGRFSELQAAFGLLSLKDFNKNCLNNKKKMHLYSTELKKIPGIRLLLPNKKEKHNYQYVVLEVDPSDFGISRDRLITLLEAENIMARRYFVPGMHRTTPYSKICRAPSRDLNITENLCKKVMQLPSGEMVSTDEIKQICALIDFIYNHRKKLKEISSL